MVHISFQTKNGNLVAPKSPGPAMTAIGLVVGSGATNGNKAGAGGDGNGAASDGAAILHAKAQASKKRKDRKKTKSEGQDTGPDAADPKVAAKGSSKKSGEGKKKTTSESSGGAGSGSDKAAPAKERKPRVSFSFIRCLELPLNVVLSFRSTTASSSCPRKSSLRTSTTPMWTPPSCPTAPLTVSWTTTSTPMERCRKKSSRNSLR